MKKFLFATTAVLFFAPLFAQPVKDMVVIKGVLNGDLKGYNTIYMYTRTTNDSAEITGGSYRFSFPFTGPVFKMLYPKYIQAMHQIYQPFGILISGPGTYYVTSDISEGMHASRLKGPEDMLLYHQFEADQSAASKKLNAALTTLYGSSWWQVNEKDPAYIAIGKSRDSLENILLVPVIGKLIRQHPDSYASAYVLSGAGRESGSLEQKQHWLSMLSPRMKKTEQGKLFADHINGLKNSRVGGTAIPFVLPDAEGKDIDFASLRGKYVLVDFWASWCVPCRRSFPHMRDLYKKYRSGQFEIYSISIDEDAEAWRKALKEENNPWLQSLDTKNIAAKGFAVTAVPCSFLIDPRGVILAREIGFDPGGEGEIEKQLDKLFKNKTN